MHFPPGLNLHILARVDRSAGHNDMCCGICCVATDSVDAIPFFDFPSSKQISTMTIRTPYDTRFLDCLSSVYHLTHRD